MSLAPVQPIPPTISSRPTYQPQSSKLTVSIGSMNSPKSRIQDSIASDSQKLSNFGSHSAFPQNPFPRPPGMQPKSSMTSSQSKPPQPSFPPPNYDIYSSPTNSTPSTVTSPFLVSNILPSQPQKFSTIPSIPTPPAMGGLLVPSKPTNFSSTDTSSHALSKDDWGDFDPLF